MPPPPPIDADDLAGRVAAAPACLGRTRLVCVDGPAGSGKTTLAEALRHRLDGSAVLHMDDVFRGWETDFDEVHERLRSQVVDPLRAGRPGRYQRYDWVAGRFAEWVDLPVPQVLLLEGVASGARSLDPWMSLLLWVEVDRAERLRRGIERDGAAMLPQWLAWTEHEAAEHARQRTRVRADLRLRGDDPATARGG